jgi:spore maturation protein CgeB
VKKTFDEVNPDIVWIEMGREINHTVIEYMKSKGAFLVNTYSDSFTDTISNKVSIQYNKSIPFYDVIFTPRESDFQLYKQYGAKRLEKFWKGFDPALISDEKSQTLDVDFIFAGHMEADRKIDLEYVLADKDFNYKIYGDGWRTSRLANVYNSLPFDQYGKIYEATKIGINYLSKWANDTQNSRLFEIPASKTMLLCEYSNDAANCFRPGIEADFFSSKEELLEKLDFYISNPIITEKITINGYRRAKQLYSNNTRVEDMLTKIHAIYI